MKQPKQEAMAELERLVDQHGGTVTPQLVIATAAKKKNPLHEYFEWDDTEAAHQYRLEQARKLIRVWVCVLPQKPRRPVRMMVSLTDDRGKEGYRRLVDVMGDTELREKLIEEAKRDMAYFRRKYALLSELAEVFEAMDKVH